MNAARASAPAKIILFGEHAVVYGRPAIAVPLGQLQATATVVPDPSGLVIRAADLDETTTLAEAPADHPLAAAVRVTLGHLGAPPPEAAITVRSTIPIASGLGSGAAVSVAIIRALAHYLGASLADLTVSELAYRVEELHHGTPSGIDNTVIALGRPVWFRRGQPIETFHIYSPFQLVIADTGVASPTRITVGDVRAGWLAEPDRYEALFDQIGAIAQQAREAIEHGRMSELGALMARNQVLLEMLGVSSPVIETLVSAAGQAGADGAKLSGGGRGGNVIALVRPDTADAVSRAMWKAGAVGALTVQVAGEERSA